MRNAVRRIETTNNGMLTLYSRFVRHPGFDTPRRGYSTSGIERLINIPENVFNILQADGQANEIGAHARGFLFFSRKLGMCCAGWMNGQRLCVAKVCNMTE